MSIVKKILAGVLVVSVLGVSGAGALQYIKKSREVEILVAPVESMASEYYSQEQTLQGTITTNVSQSIRFDDDMIVEKVYVNEGDSVSVGDKLISFDMTLVEMELGIARLKQELLQQNLDKAVRRLESLKNGGPIEDTSDSGNGTELGGTGGLGSLDMMSIFMQKGAFLPAQIQLPMLFASYDMGYEDTYTSVPDNYENSEFTQDYVPEAPSDNEFADPGQNPETVPDQSEENASGNQGADNSGSEDFIDSDDGPGDEFADEFDTNPPVIVDDNFLDAEYTFYKVLDGSSVFYEGTGTKEDPYVFFVSSQEESIIAKGDFLNLMAGYNEDGTEQIHPGGFWYQLEFHADDTLIDKKDRKGTCTGYFLVDGGLLEQPLDKDAEFEYRKEDALTFDIDLGGGFISGGGSTTTMTRDEAIKAQQNRVDALQIQMKESSLNIDKLEKKVNKKVVYSRLDGIVASAGNSGNGTLGQAYMVIKSKEGYYVKGSVSELMLDQLQVGTVLDCMSYMAGNFEATVMEVADYPTADDNGYYSSDQNPNVSYYSFSASIENQDMAMSDGDWLQISLRNETSGQDKLVIPKAFVRSENGNSYVMVDENGILRKRYISVGENVDFGYSVVIKAGLSREEYIAFPYGKNTVDGAKTKKGTVNDMYGFAG